MERNVIPIHLLAWTVLNEHAINDRNVQDRFSSVV